MEPETNTSETDIHAGGVKVTKWLMYDFVLVFSLLEDTVWHKDGAEIGRGEGGGGGGALGTFKEQLISAGSLFVISGNPLEPGSVSAPDNQGKQAMEEEMNACPRTCTTRVADDLTIMADHTPPPSGDHNLLQDVINSDGACTHGKELICITL